jgi:hypothetical protein
MEIDNSINTHPKLFVVAPGLAQSATGMDEN